MSGRYCMERGWMEHPAFAPTAYSQREAFQWLIEQAAWKPRSVNDGVSVIEIDRGELCVSIRFIAEAWRWSKSAVDRFLGHLEKHDMIQRIKKPGHAAGRSAAVIRLCNYDKFQFPAELDRDTARDTSGTQAGHKRDAGRDKIEEESRNKEIREESDSIPPNPPTLFDLSGDDAPKKDDGPSLFDQWWEQVPRKVAKKAAERAFAAALKKTDFLTLLNGIMRYAAEREGKDPEKTKHPATWLNYECWHDEPLQPFAGQRNGYDLNRVLENVLRRFEAQDAIRTEEVHERVD